MESSAATSPTQIHTLPNIVGKSKLDENSWSTLRDQLLSQIETHLIPKTPQKPEW